MSVLFKKIWLLTLICAAGKSRFSLRNVFKYFVWETCIKFIIILFILYDNLQIKHKTAFLQIHKRKNLGINLRSAPCGILIADAAVMWAPGQAQDGRSEPDRRQRRRHHAGQPRVAHQTADWGAGSPTQPQEERRSYFPAEEETPDHVPGLSGETWHIHAAEIDTHYVIKMRQRYFV